MAVQDQWLRASQHRFLFCKNLWQDLTKHYGNTDGKAYQRQRPMRMAYQYALLDHLLSAAKFLTQACLKQLANTRFDDITLLSWQQIEAVLAAQDYLSPEAGRIHSLIKQGDWATWIELQGQTDFSVASKQDEAFDQLISLSEENDLSDPDHWPIERWLKQYEALQSDVIASMAEY